MLIGVDFCRNLRVTFIHLIPCVLLVGLNARLFVAMRRAQAHHTRLLRENLHSESRRLSETNMATRMLFVVVAVFLFVEVPLAVMMITMILENTFDPLLLMDQGARSTATLLINLIILFSYPVNFFIYCGMSQQFRQTFCQLFVGHAVASDAGASEAPARPSFSRSRCADDGDRQAGHRTTAVLSAEQPDVSTTVYLNDDVDAFNMTTIGDQQNAKNSE